jgi:WD40 repeat protein
MNSVWSYLCLAAAAVLVLASGVSPQTPPVKSTEAKPELVLQTGYGANGGATRLVFSPDGRLLATTTIGSDIVKLWETATGRELRNLAIGSQSDPTTSPVVAFSRNNLLLATTGADNSIKIWDVITGRQLKTLAGSAAIRFISFAGSDRIVLVGNDITVKELATGRDLRNIDATGVVGEAVSSDSRKLAILVHGPNLLVKVLDLSTERELNSFDLPEPLGTSSELSFTADGRLLLSTISEGETVRVWDVEKRRKLATLKVTKISTSLGLSDDSKMLATGGMNAPTVLWETKSGKQLLKLNGRTNLAYKVAFSADGTRLSSGGRTYWDLRTGRGLRVDNPSAQSATVSTSDSISSPDGLTKAVVAPNNLIQISDASSGRQLRTLVGHTARINSIAFNPDATLVASAADDGSTFLWDASTGEHLLTLISLDDGAEWIAVTPQGLFDGTPVSWNQVLWRYNQDTFNVAPIEWFFNEFYSPGLIADIFAGKRPRVADDVSRKDRRQPVVKLSVAGLPAGESEFSSRRIKVKIEVTDAPPDASNPRGTGARDLRLFRNGSLVKLWPGDVLQGRPSVILEQTITIAAGPNRLTAYAFNRDNVKSKDALLALTGAETLRRAGTAYIVTIGIDKYENARYNLKYAVADARSFGEELQRRLSQLTRFQHIEVVPLLNENATKANILASLDRLKRAEPEDVVVIYFAGHGTAQAQRFYLIPHDLGYAGERNAIDQQGLQTVLEHSISDVELEQAVEQLDAGRMLLFIDACNSGQALEADEKRRGPMNSKGLAQLAYEKGMYILTAAQSYQAAIEAAQYGHGLLTYALVEEGLKTTIADSEPKDGVLSAKEWLDFATQRVPQMQQEKMQQGRGIGIAFTEGEENISDPGKRSLQRPRVFYRRELETTPLVIARSGSGPTPASQTASAPSGKLSRWLDLQTAILGTRYRFIENSSGVTVTNQLQSFVQFRGRFKFDRQGNYSINAGVFTGNGFVVGFNDTGIGTGTGMANLYLKQLYFAARPIRGVEAQYGGLYFNRGESTEITTYDNDGYLVGERILIQRPKQFFFDEISATYGFLGDLSTSNINKRWHGLKESNYHQFLISKKIGERAAVSGDYTFQSGIDTLRQALRVNTPEFKAFDFFRVEVYERVKTNPEAGLAAYAEKSLLKKKLTLGGGYADIDRFYGGLNADRFNIGRRVFFNSSYKLSPEFTLITFYTRGFANAFPISNRTRFEIFLTYDLLKTLHKTGLF